MFPKMASEELLRKLNTPKEGKIKVLLDTDAYNEVDDQFAIAYALKSIERIELQAIYAAPFHNDRSAGPADGMEKSYQEILRLLAKMDVPAAGFVFRGAAEFLKNLDKPVMSDAVNDLIEKALQASPEEPLHVVSIAAITNVASAILLRPEIIPNIVVVWLGGHAHAWKDTVEFNLLQDVKAAQVIFNCGVPLIQIPCMGVASHLLTSIPELKADLYGKSAIGDMLVDIVMGYRADHFAWAKEIWDIATIGYLVNPDWVPSHIVSSPVLTDQMTWSVNHERHFMRVAYSISRNDIFRDLFTKLS